MKERPILFSGQMVRAILEGRKTQTRRVINPQPGYVCQIHNVPYTGKNWDKEIKCPHGVDGDRLWVRENYGVSWGQGAFIDPCLNYQADMTKTPILGELLEFWKTFYLKKRSKPWNPDTWKPSIYLPREFCRLLLKLKNIRVERLKDISEKDAMAEGIKCFGYDHGSIGFWTERLALGAMHTTAVFAFRNLWDSINGQPRKKDGPDISWKANPWVWVIEFERIER